MTFCESFPPCPKLKAAEDNNCIFRSQNVDLLKLRLLKNSANALTLKIIKPTKSHFILCASKATAKKCDSNLGSFISEKLISCELTPQIVSTIKQSVKIFGPTVFLEVCKSQIEIQYEKSAPKNGAMTMNAIIIKTPDGKPPSFPALYQLTTSNPA